MNKYKFRAYNKRQKTVEGTLVANDPVHLDNLLKAQGFELIKCSPVKGMGDAFYLKFMSGVSTRDMLQFYMHLNQMQAAGVSLLAALAHNKDNMSETPLADVIIDMHRQVSDGKSLSEAMSIHPRVFSNFQISIVRSSEETGDMAAAYQNIIDYIKWADTMKRRAKKAMTYPIIVSVALTVAIVVMMAYVVPQITGFVIAAKGEEFLPFYTVLLVKISRFFQAFWWLILGLPVLFFGGLTFLTRMSEETALKVDEIILKLPIVGECFLKINIARFCRTLSVLYAAGIPLVSALKTANETVSNRIINGAISDAIEDILEGTELSNALQNTGKFPPIVMQMLKVSEESGNVNHILTEIAEFYSTDVDTTIQETIALIEPMMLAILGLLIAWVAVAVFGPIYSIFEELEF